MTDPTFGEIEFKIDAWDGLAPFAYEPSRTSRFAVHIWADESGPSALQRATFDQLKARYPSLWPDIAEALLLCHPGLISVEEVAAGLSPTIGCYIEDEGGPAHADFELVYTFDLPGEGGRGYFVRIVGWDIVEAFAAE
ncbi:hypothetical protein [Paludisphaera mucosa]|uniref:Uncharacterized protein n=1 Tax=Paludisphaera mucosa TaxID=3030827 RepID=A0ABT6FFL7_9BACT|nr:hypothetical protein [Paludisphaera mucosa]MDG3006368.1 hypothetical protein [Paludisphaera mucosa]